MSSSNLNVALHEKCPKAEFFWSIFFSNCTEYGKIQTRKNSAFGLFSSSVEDVLSLKKGLISNMIEQCSNGKTLKNST